MATTITRTAWTDDDGSGTTGTIINNAVKTSLYDQIDVMFAGAVVIGGALSGVTTLNLSSTLTGAAANFSGVLTGGTYNGQDIDSAANFTGTLTTAGRIKAPSLFDASDVTGNILGATVNDFYLNNVLVGTLNAAGLHIGGAAAARSATNPTNALSIYNGTAPAGTLTNGITLYTTAGELRVMDAAGNATLLSPHDQSSDWVFRSENTVTGKYVRIEVEQLLKRLNKKFGEAQWFTDRKSA